VPISPDPGSPSHPPKMRLCVYCLRMFPRAQMTDDHIIASSWYPDTTPSTVQRLTAPACRNCNNNKFAPIERYALVRLAMSIDPTVPGADGIHAKAMRSIDPAQAKTGKDRKHRAKQRDALMRDLVPAHAGTKGVLPFSAKNLALGVRTGLSIDGKRLDAVVEKWTRGYYYGTHRVPLSSFAKVEVWFVSDQQAGEAFENIWQHARAIDGGPGVQVRYWSAEESGSRIDICAFSLWGGQVRMYSGVNETFETGISTPA
jgi:hypothetical protein